MLAIRNYSTDRYVQGLRSVLQKRAMT